MNFKFPGYKCSQCTHNTTKIKYSSSQHYPDPQKWSVREVTKRLITLGQYKRERENQRLVTLGILDNIRETDR